MKVDRLIGIITLLLQRDQVTAPMLAERFEVSKRTINRDIDTLCRAGIPIVTVQGHGGGISLAPGYKVDKTLLTREDMQVVLAGLKGIDSVSGESYARRIAERFAGGKEEIYSEDHTILIDLASHHQKSLTEKITVIKSAVIDARVIAFTYCYRKGEQRRQIEPYLLLFRWSSWYVYGYCLDRQDFRMFKLNRLYDLEMTEERLTRRRLSDIPKDFDRYLETGQICLKALFEPMCRYRLIEEYGRDCYETTADGRLLFTWKFANYDAMREWIMSFGTLVYVLEPAELIGDLAEQYRILSKRYR